MRESVNNDTVDQCFQEHKEKELLVQRKLDLLLRTGCLLMESSADTSRIMRNMKRTATFLGLPLKNLHIYVNYNMLMVNLGDEEHSFTKFQRVDRHGINFDTISFISKLSYRAIRLDFTLDDYERELDRISHKPRWYNRWQVAVGAGFACGGFCIQFGCDWTAFLYCSLAAMTGLYLKMWLDAKGANQYVNIALAAFISTLLAWLTTFLTKDNAIAQSLPRFMLTSTPWHPMMACALYIVPGVPIINFVSDMLDGYVQIGISRAVNTLMIIAAMAFGMVFAIKICGVDNFVENLSMTPHHNYFTFAAAAAISAVGFSMIFNLPRRLLWVVAVGGIIAVCTRNFVNLGPSNGNVGLDWGLATGSLIGSALVSIICTQAMHWFHTPHHCLSIPCVIPMIPGVLMYRSLFAFIQMHGVVGEVTVATNNMIQASLVILCIAIGVAIPNIFVRKMITTKRQEKLIKLEIERRKRHGEMVDLHEL